MRAFLIFIILSFCIIAKAQKEVYIQFNQSSGLADDEVFNMFQDSHQFIWISSAGGLQKFNGKEFFSYKNSQQKTISFGDVHEDPWGRIWAQNFAGQYFYIEDDSLHLYSLKSVTENLSFNCFLDFDQDKNLLLCTQFGFYKVGFDKMNENGFPIFDKILYKENGIAQTPYKDVNKNMWFEFTDSLTWKHTYSKWDGKKLSKFEFDPKLTNKFSNLRFAFEWENEI